LASSLYRGGSRFNVHGDDEVEALNEKIKLYKKELEKLAAFGRAKQQEHHRELGRMDNELYRKRVELHRLGERAKIFFTFWDYVKIVQRATPTVWSPETMTFIESESETSESSYAGDDLTPAVSSPPASRSNKSRSKSPKPRSMKSPGRPKRKGSLRKKRQLSRKDEKKRMMVPRSPTDMTFTIFGFFEAYLLRRLHLALLLKNQSTMQRHRWNDIIVYCYDEIPATKRDTQQAREWLDYLKSVTPTYQKTLQETLERLLAIQDKLMQELRSHDERRKGLAQQAFAQQKAIPSIREAPAVVPENDDDDDDEEEDDEYRGSLPTITLSSGEIEFEDEDDVPTSAFSYNIHNTEEPPPPAVVPPPPPEGRIYATSEFNTGVTGMTPEIRGRKSTAKKAAKSSSAHDKVFECKGSSDSGSEFSDDDSGDEQEGVVAAAAAAPPVKKEKVVAAAANNKKDKGKKQKGSKWSMSWKVPALDSDSEHASSDVDLKMSADNTTIGNEYGRISMRDDDDEDDDDKFDFVSQEANRQPMASSALAGPASMMMLQKSIRAQQEASKQNAPEHFQLSTAGSEDDGGALDA